MGFAASHARIIALISRKSDLELEQDFANRSRLAIANAAHALERVRPESLRKRENILRWLSPCDNEMFDFHWTDTAFLPRRAVEWLQSREFSSWMADRNSLLWVHGDHESGKTALCASVIERLKQLCRENTDSAVAFFYSRASVRFDTQNMLLRRLLRQFISQVKAIPPGVTDRFRLGGIELDSQELLVMLHSLTESLSEAFILIDGIDECEERTDFLAAIKSIHSWNIQGLHIFMTSRTRGDIVETFKIDISVDLSPDPKPLKLRDCLPKRLQVGTTLDEFQLPMHSDSGIRQRQVGNNFFQAGLENNSGEERSIMGRQSEPQTSTELYERILLAVEVCHRSDMSIILHFLSFAARPISLLEISDMLTVTPSLGLSQKAQMPQQMLERLLELCGPLLHVNRNDANEKVLKTYLVEDSFRRYISSGKPKQGPLEEFFVSEEMGHLKILNICLTYLLQFNHDKFFDLRDIKQFPFAHYAAQYWYAHAWASQNRRSNLSGQQMLEDAVIHCNSIRIFDPEWPSARPHLARPGHTISSLLYYAALTGREDSVRIFLQRSNKDNDGQGLFGSPLQAAAAGAHNGVVRLLIDSGADLNDHCGCYGTALCAAAATGDHTVVKTLLYAGADPNLGGTNYGQLLYQAQATEWVDWHIVERADQKFDTVGPIDNALLMATYGGHAGVIKILVGGGADIDAKDSVHGRTPLIWATIRDDPEIVEILLTAGADLNLADNQGSTALQISLEHHFDRVTESLLRRDAEISGDTLEYALQTSMKVDPACYRKDKKLTDRLRGKGAQATSVEVLLNPSAIDRESVHILRKCFSLQGDSVQRLRRNLLRERDVLQKLHHPNIVQFLGYRENRRRKSAYLYMEYCDAGDLTQFLAEDAFLNSLGESLIIDTNVESGDNGSYESETSSVHSLSPQRRLLVTRTLAWSMLEQISAALAYCHHGVMKDRDEFRLKHLWQQVLHRDIKPANVVMNEVDGVRTVKLCDLGLVRVRDDLEKQTLGLGTLAFMPPEVKYEMRPWSTKGDCYSVGATFKSMAKDFEDSEWDAVLADCLQIVSQDRPSSLMLLQSAREALSRLGDAQLPSTKFLTTQNEEMNYLQLATFELLGRFFRTFKRMKANERSQLAARIQWLQEDTRTVDQYDWTYLDFVYLALVFQDRRRLGMILDQEVNDSNLECSWDTRGLSPFHIAAQDGDFEILDLLLQRRQKQPHVIKWLDLAATDHDGETAAHLAAAHEKSQNLGAVLAVLEKLVNAKDNFGRTPLHRAAANGHIVVVQGLVAAGAHVHCRSLSGLTAEGMAASGNYIAVANYLEKVEWQGNTRMDALQKADKILELESRRHDTQIQAALTEIESVQRVIGRNIEMSFKLMK